MSKFTDLAQNFIYEKRSGTSGDPYVEKIESFKIVNNLVLLSEIPDSFSRVRVVGNDVVWSEVHKDEKIGVNNYKVDYLTGFVTFHPDRNGLTNTFEYMGTGVVFISASRIFTKYNRGNILETLQDILDTAVTKFIFSTEDPDDDDGNPNGTVWFKYIP